MVKSREHVVTNGRAVFYASLWNDFRQAALDCGWALALHGSMANDLDIMAMPWTEDAKPIEECLKAIQNCLTPELETPWMGGEDYLKPHPRPSGRITYTIHIWADFYIDLNIMPIINDNA